MAKESIKKTVTTGKGVITGYVSLFKPSVKFNKSGVYSCSIILPKEEGQRIEAIVKEIAKEQFKTYGKVKAAPVQPIQCITPLTNINDDGEEINDPSGQYVLKTAAKAWIENGVPTNKIVVFDSHRNPVKNLNIGAGSTVRLFVSFEGYTVAGKTGVSAVLKAVQIIDLVEYGDITATEAGFEDENGFEYIGNDIEEDNVQPTDEEVSEEDF